MWWWWAGLVLVAVRTAILVSSVPLDSPLDADEPFYDELARNLLSGQGYMRQGAPTALRPPGWPLLLAGLRLLFGEGRLPILLFQSLCDAGSALIMALLARRLFGNRLAGAVTFLFVVIWPPYFRESRLMQTEPVFTFLVALMLWVFTRVVHRPGRAWFLLGLTTVAAVMVRPPALFLFMGLGLAWLVLVRPTLRQAVSSTLWTSLGIVLVVTPWTIRNAVVFHSFIPISLGSGDQLHQGTLLETEGRWIQPVWLRERGKVLAREEERLGRPPTSVEADRATFRAAIETVRTHPGRSTVIALKRLWRMWLTPAMKPDRPWLRGGFFVTLVIVYLLAFPAGFRALRTTAIDGRLPAVFLAGWIVVMTVSSVFLTTSRYAEPFRTIPLMLAAGGLTRMPPRREGPAQV